MIKDKTTAWIAVGVLVLGLLLSASRSQLHAYYAREGCAKIEAKR